ncbi:MAG: UbiA family prenyltransferase, partial [Chitinophagales bacterium]|nr:UbiA family prenyltransferase [Chitinophagales bacterium]
MLKEEKTKLLTHIPYIRAHHWWSYKTTPILGFIYFYCDYFNHVPSTQLSAVIFFFILSYVGFAGLGYTINDMYDIEVDKKAGKINQLGGKSVFFKVQLILLLSILAWAPWLYLRSPWYIPLSFVILLLLLLTYSHPYTRLKEHSLLGPIWDALYGHVLPILITCFTFQQYLQYLPYNEWVFYSSLIIWQFLKGLRNILIHQLDDYANDLSSGTQTLVTIYGKERVYHQILKWILPLELVFLLLFLTTLGVRFYHIWIFCLLFIFIYRFGHGLFTHRNWDKENHTKNTYLYILNDFYEMYLPFYFLLSFCFKRPEYILFLIIHILL